MPTPQIDPVTLCYLRYASNPDFDARSRIPMNPSTAARAARERGIEGRIEDGKAPKTTPP
jgi:hypothetical protein